MATENGTAPEKTISLITTSRDELFTIGQILARSLSPRFLLDKKNPVLVGLNGTFNSGKVIIAEKIRTELLGSTPLSRGRQKLDEYWTGKYRQKKIEVDFIDVLYKKGYSTIKTTDNQARTKEFLSQRRCSGITFVQNDHDFAETDAGIEVWIEKKYESVYNGARVRRIHGHELKYTFDYYADQKPWTRLVEIKVRDPRLLSSEKFMQGLESIAALGHIRIKNTGLLAKAVRGLTDAISSIRRDIFPTKEEKEAQREILFAAMRHFF